MWPAGKIFASLHALSFPLTRKSLYRKWSRNLVRKIRNLNFFLKRSLLKILGYM